LARNAPVAGSAEDLRLGRMVAIRELIYVDEKSAVALSAKPN
jgi:hypothetical protein